MEPQRIRDIKKALDDMSMEELFKKISEEKGPSAANETDS